MSYAEVAVNAPTTHHRTFCYAIPPGLAVEVGQAVWVPFGPRLLQGIVTGLSEQPSVEETREIAGIIDPRPLLSPHQVELACWISHRYLCPPFEAAALMLPPGFERRTITYLQATAAPPEPSSLSPAKRKVLGLLSRGRVEVREIEKALGKREASAAIGQLVRQGLITKVQELERAKVGPKMEPRLHLAVSPSAAREEARRLNRRAPLKARLLELLASQGIPLSLSQVQHEVPHCREAVKALVREGMVTVEEVPVFRDPLAHRVFERRPAPTLTSDQEKVWREIERAIEQASPGVFLLHGVTGSGKTEIYLRALAAVVARGGRGIVLVPEIALTPQTVERFWARFPHRVAVLHSQLSLGELYDEWWRIKEGGFDVVVGSRSAIFAPQPALGLIVIDEEHEWTYKQPDPSPRYHAREVALKLGELHKAVAILGSATPDTESFYRGQQGQYRLLQLPHRITADGQAPLPQVELVDLRQELRAGNRSIFSCSLQKAMATALSAGEQVILFLNRRGAATHVQCRDCGYVVRCPRCDISLTYHSAQGDMLCHLCNRRTSVSQICPQCRGRRIRFLGIGTEKVEEEAAKLFPQARLLRWDRDVTRGRHSHEAILDQFIAHRADVLIGTQMVAKGLDLPEVTLVGVINADISLHLPDLRAGERTFQLLTQVAGRAGRGPLGGRVIVQTYTPDHYAIVCAAHHDYLSFYEREISFRRQHHNPPFRRLARLVYTHPNPSLCRAEAERMGQLLKEERDRRGLDDIAFIGPAPAYAQRVRGRFRWQLILRGKEPAQLLTGVPIPQGWVVDIDPVSLL